MLTCNPNVKPVIVATGPEIETTEEESNSDLKMKIINKRAKIEKSVS